MGRGTRKSNEALQLRPSTEAISTELKDTLLASQKLGLEHAKMLLSSKEIADQLEGQMIVESVAADLLLAGKSSPALEPYKERWNRVLDDLPGRSRLHRIWEGLWGSPPYNLARWAEARQSLGDKTPAEQALREHLRESDLRNPPSADEQARQLCLIRGTEAVRADPRLRELEASLRENETALRQESNLGKEDSPLLMLPHSGWYQTFGQFRPSANEGSAGLYSVDHNLVLVFGDRNSMERCLGGSDSDAILYAARHELLHSQQPENIALLSTLSLGALAAREIIEGLTESLNRHLGGRSVPRPPYSEEVEAIEKLLAVRSLEDIQNLNRQNLEEIARSRGYDDASFLLSIWQSATNTHRGP